jgi:hypothetical protein
LDTKSRCLPAVIQTPLRIWCRVWPRGLRLGRPKTDPAIPQAALLGAIAGRRGHRMSAPATSWCDPAVGSPAQVRSSVRLVASVAWPLATVQLSHRRCMLVFEIEAGRWLVFALKRAKCRRVPWGQLAQPHSTVKVMGMKFAARSGQGGHTTGEYGRKRGFPRNVGVGQPAAR